MRSGFFFIIGRYLSCTLFTGQNPDPAGQDIEVRCHNQGPNQGVNREVLLPEEEC